MTAAYATDLEEARLRLSEAFLKLWDQADLIDGLFRAGKPTKAAEDLLAAMQRAFDELSRQVELSSKIVRPKD